jgi:hypothetical protein
MLAIAAVGVAIIAAVGVAITAAVIGTANITARVITPITVRSSLGFRFRFPFWCQAFIRSQLVDSTSGESECADVTDGPPEKKSLLAGITSQYHHNGDLRISWNIAPTQDTLAIQFNPESKQRTLGTLRWGLIPNWAKHPKIASQDNQCEGRNGRYGSVIPTGVQETPLPDSRGWLLRMESSGRQIRPMMRMRIRFFSTLFVGQARSPIHCTCRLRKRSLCRRSCGEGYSRRTTQRLISAFRRRRSEGCAGGKRSRLSRSLHTSIDSTLRT